MNGINLIPAPRRAARRRRAHLRYCAAACVAWAVLMLGAVALAHAIWREQDPQTTDRLARVNEEIQRTERVIATTRADLAAAQSTLRANQTIAAQPDWSVLLALLGRQVGNDVVLKSCKVRQAAVRTIVTQAAPRPDARRPAAAPAASPAPAAPGPNDPLPFVMEASGMAVDHDAAGQFVLRLEKTGLFSKVALLDTAREPFFDRNAIAFRLECSLNQAPARDAATKAAGSAAGNAASANARGGE